MWATGVVASPSLASIFFSLKSRSWITGSLWYLSTRKVWEQLHISIIEIFSWNSEFLLSCLPSLHLSWISCVGFFHLWSCFYSRWGGDNFIPPFHCPSFHCFSNYFNFRESAFSLFLFMVLNCHWNLTLKSCIVPLANRVSVSWLTDPVPGGRTASLSIPPCHLQSVWSHSLLLNPWSSFPVS